MLICSVTGVSSYSLDDFTETAFTHDNTNPLTSFAIDRESGKIFAVGKSDYFTVYYNYLDKEKDISKARSETLKAVAVSSDGNKIISSGKNQNLHLWSVNNGRYLRKMANTDAGTNDIKIISDKNILITADKDKCLRIYSISDYGYSPIEEIDFDDEILNLDYNESSSNLVFSAGDKIYFLNLDSESEDFLYPILFIEEETVYEAIFSPNGNFIFSVKWDGIIEQWLVEDGSLINSFNSNKEINDIVISNDGRFLFTGTKDGVLLKWDIDSLEKEELNFYTAIGSIHSLYYIYEQDLIFVGGDVNEIIAYDLSTESVSFTLKGHTSSIMDIIG